MIEDKKPLCTWLHYCTELVRHIPHEFTLRQWGILLYIYLERETHTVRSLAATFGIPKPAVTRSLDALARRGLVKRVRDEKDKRIIFVMRTMAGIAFLNQCHDIMDVDEKQKKELYL